MDNISPEVVQLIEDLDLVPSTLITPTILQLIEHEFRMREFDLSADEKRYRQYFYNRMRERERLKRKRVVPLSEKQIKLNF